MFLFFSIDIINIIIISSSSNNSSSCSSSGGGGGISGSGTSSRDNFLECSSRTLAGS
jgi:hypothetical protein